MIGLTLLLLNLNENLWIDFPYLRAIVGEFASFLLVTVSIALIWEILGKQSFLEEILVKTNLSNDLILSGLIRTPPSFRKDIVWEDYFKSIKEFDIYICRGSSWRSTNYNDLEELARDKKLNVRIILPDFESNSTVEELSKRFDEEKEEIINSIKKAQDDFKKLFPQSEQFPAKMEMKFLPEAPVYSMYRLDNTIIVALFSHIKAYSVNVPTFICEKGGFLYDYFFEQFNNMFEKFANTK